MSINYNPNHMFKSGFINACFNLYCALNIINNFFNVLLTLHLVYLS